jgi:hypothetical protein
MARRLLLLCLESSLVSQFERAASIATAQTTPTETQRDRAEPREPRDTWGGAGDAPQKRSSHANATPTQRNANATQRQRNATQRSHANATPTQRNANATQRQRNATQRSHAGTFKNLGERSLLK